MLRKLKERRQRIKQEKSEAKINKEIETRQKLHNELERLKREEDLADLRLRVQRTNERISRKKKETSSFHKLTSKLKEVTDDPGVKPTKSKGKSKKKNKKSKSKSKEEEIQFWEL